MRRFKRIGAAVCAAVLLTSAAWARNQKAAKEAEGQVRRAAFQYYVTMVLGATEEHLKAFRIPLLVVRDGAAQNRDEKAARALLAGFANRLKDSKSADEDRATIVKGVVALFDEASVQFIGSNTASVTFLARHGKDEKEGDYLVNLTLYRVDGQWKVIAELTDSTPVPPDYLK